MLWKLAADAVVLVHLFWILFILLGALIGRHVAWVKWLHLGALAFSFCLQVFDWVCPLTYLEVWLRRQHDPSLGYAGDFLAHYAAEVVYLSLPPDVVLAVTLLVISLSFWAYWGRSAGGGVR